MPIPPQFQKKTKKGKASRLAQAKAIEAMPEDKAGKKPFPNKPANALPPFMKGGK